MDLFIRLTYKDELEETTLNLSEGTDGELLLTPIGDKEKTPIIVNKNEDGNLSIPDISCFKEDENQISEKLLGLAEDLMEAKAQGMELTSEDEESTKPKPGYDPDDIYVENKPFSIRQLIDLIEQGDLDLAPNFQRNFVWDRTRQSLLIESILLGLPLPALYLSQYSDGILTIVDGLQRIHTIKNFMDDKLRLCNLEYLTECNGKTFKEVKEVLSPLRMRRFGQTQLMCFVIDYRSPSELKFDLFRRLNTGSKPLNRQEIRNCLSRTTVQKALRTMSSSNSFQMATDKTIKDRRMQAQETALRFLLFRSLYTPEHPAGSYNGYMDNSLDNFVDELNTKKDLQTEIKAYDEAMKSAFYLFGTDSFRKKATLGARRPSINKMLMLCLSVLLSFHSYEEITQRLEPRSLIKPMNKLIEGNKDFYNAITYTTNSKTNIETAMKIIRDELLKLD